MSLSWGWDDLGFALQLAVIILVIRMIPDLAWWQYLLLGVSYVTYALIEIKRKGSRT